MIALFSSSVIQKATLLSWLAFLCEDFQAPSFVPLASGDDAVIEADAARLAGHGPHSECRRSLLRHIQCAVAEWREKDVIRHCQVDRLGEDVLDCNHSLSI